MLCDSCRENPASVVITQIVNEGVSHLRLCESCARQRGADNSESSIEEMVYGLFEEMDKNHDETPTAPHDDSDGLYINEVFMEIQSGDPFGEDSNQDLNGFDNRDGLGDDDFIFEEFDDDDLEGLPEDLAAEMEAAEDAADDLFDDSINELIKSSPFADTSEKRDLIARRCPKCSITWDRLRQDGRAGCSQCYEAFSDQLHEVMQRVQHAPHHHGKKPRAAEKRRNRLEHLRARRDHRLEMLHRRLDEAVRAEKYEEAAKLRDQIKMVESTIVQDS